MEDDVPLEPPAADPYLQKAKSLLKLRSPQLDEREDAQVAKATLAETLPETSPPAEVAALTCRSHEALRGGGVRPTHRFECS